ncbi:MAG: glycosyltransferase family 39 protein [Flavobacteriales bacterium]|nr:glycosyltransferase family 39 protein [Flavobacteriales bacterium]
MKIPSSLYFLIFIVAVFFIALSPTLFSHGMFMDGIYYAMIARNLAEGLGDFWNPQLTDTLAKQFNDHPPLVFGIQSLFFQFFGDYHWVERLYSLLCYLIGGGLMISIWKRLAPQVERSLYWLPLLLWLTVPKMVWGTSNNLLENTMMLFLMASVIFQLKALEKNKILYFFIAGVFIFFAFLAKGFTAFFPLSFLFFYWLFRRPFSFIELIKKYIVFVIGLLLPFGLLYFIPDAYESLTKYYNIQIIGGLGAEQSVGSRFYIIRRVSQELTVMTVLWLLLFLLNKFLFKKSVKSNSSLVYIFLCTALSGVLPILISMKQSTFYVIPAFPLFSIGIGFLIAPLIQHWIIAFIQHKKAFSIFKIASTALLGLSIILLLLPINQTNRDKIKLNDVRKIISSINEKAIIGIDVEIRREWSYYAYFYRYGHISIDYYEPKANLFIIVPKDKEVDYSEYTKLKLDLKSLDLYQKEEN